MKKKQILRKAGLYLFLDSNYVAYDQMVGVAQQMVAGGAEIIQLRDKKLSAVELVKLGLHLRKIIPEDVIFMINDYVELAKKIGADGVHLGQEDTRSELARKKLGEYAIIGLSTHSISQAEASKDKPVDYIGYGPIYSTRTKPEAVPIGPEGLSYIRNIISVPIFAIGGIDQDNIVKILGQGADGVAIVSAVLESENILNKTQELISKVNEIKGVYHEV